MQYGDRRTSRATTRFSPARWLSTRSRSPLHLAAVAALAISAAFMALPGSAQNLPSAAEARPPVPGLPGNQPERGLVFDGLEPGSASVCAGGLRVKNSAYCTHGPDAAPVGVDVRVAAARPDTSVTAQSAAVQCDGDGVTGNRTEVLYVRGADRPDAFATYQASIQQWAADADAIYLNSAAKTGGVRRIRFVHDSSCAVVVRNVVLGPTGNITFNNMITALQAQGYNRADRKYMIFMDANVYCGIGTLYGDDSAVQTNANNRGPSYARVDRGCWNGSTMAHESMHNMGGVQRSAPHSTGLQNPNNSNTWHCSDEYDRMCYVDAPGVEMTYPCASSNEQLFDCGNDDYFNPNPAAGSYLATHWNTAANQFLIQGTGSPPPPPTGTLHVADLDGARASVNRNNWRATVTIKVVDNNGAAVSSATVNGAWSGGTAGGASCTTGASGLCSVTSGNLNLRNVTAVTFTVSAVSHAALGYDAGANADPDGDSNGTSITITRP